MIQSFGLQANLNKEIFLKENLALKSDSIKLINGGNVWKINSYKQQTLVYKLQLTLAK